MNDVLPTPQNTTHSCNLRSHLKWRYEMGQAPNWQLGIAYSVKRKCGMKYSNGLSVPVSRQTSYRIFVTWCVKLYKMCFVTFFSKVLVVTYLFCLSFWSRLTKKTTKFSSPHWVMLKDSLWNISRWYLRGHRGEVKQQPPILWGCDDVEVVVVGEGDERAMVPRQPSRRQRVLRQQQLADVATLVSIAAAIALRFCRYNTSLIASYFIKTWI